MQRTRVNTEELEQTTLMNWAKMQSGKFKELNLLFHIPNGGLRSKTEAKRLKGAGVKAGVPDLFLPVATNGYHGLFIELKAPRGKTTNEQKYWIAELNKEGYRAVVCFGWIKAVEAINDYLNLGIKI